MGIWSSLRRLASTKGKLAHASSAKPERKARSRKSRDLRMEEFEHRMLLTIGTWVPQGPAPILDGQTANVAPKDALGNYLNMVTGAVQTVVAHPTDPDVLYVGSVNGGIWRTDNASAANPTWTTHTDLLSSLSISSLAFDPMDTTYNTLVAGTGLYSNYGRVGGNLEGLFLTSNGGASWSEVDGKGLLDGKNISAVAARGNVLVVAVSAAVTGNAADAGIFRSTDGGLTFTQISRGNGAATGIPAGLTYDLAYDTTATATDADVDVMYTAVTNASTANGRNGIYKSTDAGASWQKVSTAAMDVLILNDATTYAAQMGNVRIAVSPKDGSGRQAVFVGIVSAMTGELTGVFRSMDGGGTWTRMDTPETREGGQWIGIHPGGQGATNFSFVAQSTTVVYAGGDRQPANPGWDGIEGTADDTFPNSIGSTNYTGRLFRGDASAATGSQWAHITDSSSVGATGGGTGSDSGPHADSRDMTFDANGRLIEVDDGGIYVRTEPADDTGDWYSLNGNLQINEMHDIAYDTVSNIIIGGSQDTGVSEQESTGSLVWREVSQGDGGDVSVAVDDLSLVGRNQSYRYTSAQFLGGFTRRTIDANNNVVPNSQVYPNLMVFGTGGMTFDVYDGGQFTTPVELNLVEPWRMVIAGNLGIYESFDRGDTLIQLNGPQNANAMVYGGYDVNSTQQPEVLWVASDSGVYLRGIAGGGLNRLTAYPGGPAKDIAVDTADWRKAFVIDDSHIYYTANAGASWTNITGNYSAANGLQSLAYVASGSTGAIVVGGQQGIYVAQAADLTSWIRLGEDLPLAPVYEMDYDAKDDVLVAGTLGRGAWSLSQARVAIFGVPELVAVYTDEGEPLADNAKIEVGPRELTLVFNKTAAIDPKTLDGIQITRAGLDGVFVTDDPTSTDDVIVPVGYKAIGNNSNEVIIRFSENLADDEYHITLVGEDNYAGPDGVVIGPLKSLSGISFHSEQQTLPSGQTVLVGRNLVRNFILDLGAQVTAVVPQPVERFAYTDLQVTKVPQVGDILAVTRQTTPTAVSRNFQLTNGYFEVANVGGKVQINDGDTLTIRGFSGTTAVTRVYEFNVTGTALADASHVAIPMTAGGQALNTTFLDLVCNTITNDTAIDVVASHATYTGAGVGRISLNGYTGTPQFVRTSTLGPGLVVRNTIAVPATSVGVYFETSFSKTNVANSLTAAMRAGGLGLVDADFTTVPETVRIANTIPIVYGLTNVKSAGLAIHDGAIDQAKTAENRDVIDVYFNINDPLLNDGSSASVSNTQLYQLIFTQETATPADDTFYTPLSAAYSPATGRVRLTFGDGLASGVDDLSDLGTGSVRLRIGNQYLPIQTTTWTPTNTFDRTTFAAADADAIPAATLGDGGAANLAGEKVGGQSVLISGAITSQPYSLLFPGGADEPGHRWMASHEINVDPNYDSHQGTGGDTSPGASEVIRFFFPAAVGGYPNQINETERDLVRQIFEMYARYLGVQVDEGTDSGSAIFVGDSRAFKPTAPPQAGGGFATIGAGYVFIAGGTIVGQYDDVFGGNFWGLMMHEIGHNFGYLHEYDMPTVSIMGSSGSTYVTGSTEGVYPGESDIIHGQLIHRPDSNDIDLYSFTLDKPGELSAETLAERLNIQDGDTNTVSLLNTLITVYDSNKQVIARNDDYYGIDSFVNMHLGAGTYYVAVTASGNQDFNPEVDNSGLYGRTSGSYQLRMTFTPDRSDYLSDADYNHTAIDGDLDGRAKGVYDFWTNVQPTSRTVYVDKDAPGTSSGNGTVADPYRTVSQALTAAGASASTAANYVVRIVGNNYANDTSDPATLADNIPYRIGANASVSAFSDGRRMEIPHAVTVVIDGGAVMQFQDADIDVGSSDQNADRSLSQLQVVGTPWHSVYFTSAKDQVVGKDMDASNTSAEAGDWGGLVFRNKEDYNTQKDTNLTNDRLVREQQGIFLNYVNHADIRYGGGEVSDFSQTYDPIHMIQSRPTATFNTISYSVHHGMSADPDSFAESLVESMPGYGGAIYTADYDRVGPKLYGNLLRHNSLNGLFVRVDADPVSGTLDKLHASARFDDTDIVHVLEEFLAIQGDEGGPLDGVARPHGRLMIDPGTVFKLADAHIEVEFGAQFIAEGVKNLPVIVTSLYDNRYGAGGTFLTDRELSQITPTAGDWGGIEFQPTSTGSIDRTRLYYAGGRKFIEGQYAYFNPVEIRQADVRVTNTLFQYNTAHSDGDRIGRGWIEPATIFVRGCQPVIVGNTFRDNDGAVVSIDANALKYTVVKDWGRSTGTIGDPSLGQNAADQFSQYSDNHGPLVRANRMTNNDLNGMKVRATLLTTESIWDDTDIVHILTGEISIPNFHTYGGLRLQSSPTESLVVKLLGNSAGFTAAGRPLEIEDRIGGVLQVEGTPGYPVILTSLRDDTVGAGFDPDGNPQFDTNNNGLSTGSAGDWRSLKIDWYAHDRNVAMVNELESSFDNNNTTDGNGTPRTPQILGSLANAIDPRPEFNSYQGTWVDTQNLGDENLRLGFEVHGSIRTDYAGDQDVYQFSGVAGTEVWIDVDKADYGLDTIVELLDVDGNVLAWSDDSLSESSASSTIVPVTNEVVTPTPLDMLRQYQLQNYPTVPGSVSGNILVTVPGVGTGSLYTFTVDAADQVTLTRNPMFPVGTYPLWVTAATYADSSGTLSLTWNVEDVPTTSIRANYSYYVWQPSDYNSYRGLARNMARDSWESRDFYTTNPHDAGFRVVLPGTAGTQQRYFVRVRAKVRMVQSLDAKNITNHSTFTVTNSLTPSPQQTGARTWSQVFEFVDLDSDSPTVSTLGAQGIFFHKTTNPPDAIGVANLVKAAIDTARGGLGLNLAVSVSSDSINKTAQLTIAANGADDLVSFDVGDSKLVRMNPGGTYQLQVRLREIQENPGCAVQGAYIAYATNGIEVYGAPSHSALTGETAATGTNTTAATSQYVGNLLLSDREAITIAGALTGTNVQFFSFDIDSKDTIQRAKPYGMEWPVTIDVDFADNLSRADTSVWVFDNSGRLLLIGGDSNVVDDLALSSLPNDYSDQSRGSYGVHDAFIGPVYLPEHQDALTGGPISYTMAVTNQNVVPSEIVNDPLLRIEPVNSIQRIAEDHVGTQNGSNLAQDAKYTLLDGTAGSMSLNVNANPFSLGDVTLYMNTSSNLYTVDPYTGAGETDVTQYGNLPDYTWGYTDIAMTNDGRLDTLVHQTNSNNIYLRQMNTGDAKQYVSSSAVGITTYEITPGSNPPAIRAYAAGLTFNAMAHSPNNNNRNIFAVGNFVGNPNGVNWTQNLMYVLNSAGAAITRPGSSGGARLVSDIIPYGYLYTAPTLVMSAATQTSPDNIATGTYTAKGAPYIPSSINDLDDGQSFVINDAAPSTNSWTFEFDTGPDYRLAQNGPRSFRDGDQIRVNGQLFEFDSGEVVILGNGGNIAEGDTIQIVSTTGLTRYKFTYGGSTTPFRPIVIDPTMSAQAILKVTVDTINADAAASGVTVRGYLDPTSQFSRLSFFGTDSNITTTSSAANGVAVDPTTGYNVSGGLPIYFEEIMTDANGDALDDAADIQADTSTFLGGVPANVKYVGMQATVNAVFPNVLHFAVLNSAPNTYGARVTFTPTGAIPNVTVAVPKLSIGQAFQQMDSSASGTTIPGAFRVLVHADDTASQIATAVAGAINGQVINITGAAGRLTAQASGGGVALNNLGSGSIDYSNAAPVSFQGTLGSSGGDITGMAFVGNTLYAVTDTGGLFEIENVYLSNDAGGRGAWGFNEIDPASGFKYMVLGAGGPTLRYITTLTANGQPIGAGNPGIAFSGLTRGPQSVEEGKYADMLFASDSGGRVYAFDTTGVLQPVFLDAATSIATGVGGATGIAFSNIDYNLWHSTNQRGGDAGHGIEQSWDLSRDTSAYHQDGATSMYFGIEDPRDIHYVGGLPGIGNYVDRSANMFNTYDLPGGAYGSFTTNPFSLEGYAAADKPKLYFNYYAQTEGGTSWDGCRVYLSYDNVSWFLLNTNTDMDSGDIPGDVYGVGGTKLNTTSGSWRQARVDLSAAAGLGNLRLRFEFSTASDMEVGDINTTGQYFAALDGWKLRDGQTITVSNPDTTFELEMGYSLELPTFGGAGIPEGETLLIGTTTFEFSRDAIVGNVGGVPNIRIQITDLDTTNEVLLNIRDTINANYPGARAWIHTDANGVPDDNWIFLMGVTATVTNAASPTQTLQVHGDLGTAPGNVQIQIEADDTDVEVAEAIATAMDETYRINPITPATATMTGVHITAKKDGQANELNVLRFIGHAMTDHTEPVGATAFPYADQSYGVSGSDPNHPIKVQPDRFFDYGRGQNNHFEGFYIDDIIIGFAERGEMVTGTSSGRPAAAGMQFIAYPGAPTDYPVCNSPAGSAGPYQVEIHRTQEYGYKHDTDMTTPPRHLSLNVTYDTNDRMSQSISLEIPDAADIRQGQSFTIGDGVNKLTFQFFVDDPNAVVPAAGQPGSPITGAIPILVPATMTDAVSGIDEPTTGAQVASLVMTAINDNNYSSIISARRNSIKVYAEANGQNNRVDLSGAGWVDLDDEVTAGSYTSLQFPNPTFPYEAGDDNHVRDQGSMILENNQILNAAGWGIVVAPNELTSNTTRDGTANLSHIGTVNPFRQVNTTRQVPGVVIQNNVVAFSGTGGITFRGDPNTGNVADAAVPFGRIINNTVYGGTAIDRTSSFNIDIDFTGGLTASQQSIFSAAARRWERVITADLPDVGTIDDVLIDASGADIDGPGGVLGQAGPSGVRNGSYLPFAGGMQFDTADLAAMEANGSLLDVITHEMGHVLGFGTIWTALGLLSGGGTANPGFTGPMAIAEYNRRFGATATAVPVEAGGGPGTAYAHWSESVFNNELMTGWLNAGSNPLSAITAASMGDMGYQVDVTAADTYLYAVYGDVLPLLGTMITLSGPFTYADANAGSGGTPGGVGIQVRDNAAPTLLNNVIANNQTGITVDASSNATIVGYTAYCGNGTNIVANLANAEQGAMFIGTTEPLFVDPAHNNFYPDVGAKILDSSQDAMPERFELHRVRLDLGIPDSPILAPDTDMYGQKRMAGPVEQGGKGSGSNVYKDRGAVDRVDIEGPTAVLVYPVDNGVTDNIANDREPAVNSVRVAGVLLPQFTINLRDLNARGSSGVGINDFTVKETAVHVYRDRTAGSSELQVGRDYFFKYNTVKDQIDLIPAEGFWPEGYVYTVILDATIRDLANNALATNGQDPLDPTTDVTLFTIAVAGFDYGDAPDGIPGSPSYPVLAAHGEARHLLKAGYSLGYNVNSETEAKTTLLADGDQYDDGVLFERVEWSDTGTGFVFTTAEFTEPIGNGVPLVRSTVAYGARTYFTIVATGDGFVDGWIDWNADGTWDDTEHIVVASDLQAGVAREFSVEVPTTATLGQSFARFRFSSNSSGLGATGEAEDGEVEDYLVNIVSALEDFGDAPDQTSGVDVNYPTLLVDNGARHTFDPLNPLSLGGAWSPETDGRPDFYATGDDDDGVYFYPYQAPFVPGQPVKFTVDVMGSVDPSNLAYLNAWIDFNTTDLAPFTGTDEHLLLSLNAGDAGSSYLSFEYPGRYDVWTTLPDGIIPSGQDSLDTFIRIRLSHANADSPAGLAPGTGDGEVEDYAITIVSQPIDYGDAPDGITGSPSYPTLSTSDGPRHAMSPAFCLGTFVDYESNGWADSTAVGDDVHGSINPITGLRVNDEDGVSLPVLRSGETATITVTVTGTGGYLTGWIDYNGDGDFGDAGEQVFADEVMDTATKDFVLVVPTQINKVDLVSRDTFARFRYSTTPDLSYSQLAADPIPDGEVEDYQVTLQVGTATVSGTKFNDLNANGKWDSKWAAGPTVDFIGSGASLNLKADDMATYVPLGFSFEFYGQTYQGMYVSTNGAVSFGYPQYFYWPGGFPVGTPMIAPFWADLDSSASGDVQYSSGITASGHSYVEIDWVRMGYPYYQTTPTDTFRLYMEDDPGGDIVAFEYGAMGYVDTVGGAQVGFDSGNGTDFVSVAQPTSTADLAALMTARQYSFRFDPATGEPFGAEPGLAGVPVYLDIDNDLTWDLTEPMTVTLADNPLTQADEQGTYKFDKLFPGTYTVREITPTDWVQTLPNSAGSLIAPDGSLLADKQTFTLTVGGTPVVFEFDNAAGPVGVTPGRRSVSFRVTDSAATVAQSIATAINLAATARSVSVSAVAVDNNVALGGDVVFSAGTSPLTSTVGGYGYTLTLAANQTISGVNFGNYKIAHVTVSDVQVLEGNSGTTQVQLNVNLTESFGAPVTVRVTTSDGSGATGATVGDSDYEPLIDQLITFTPQAAPMGVWDLKQVTRNVVNDYDYSVSGNKVVWEEYRNGNWEIFLYDDATGKTKQLSQTTTENHFAKIYGSYVVWNAKPADGTDYEIYLYDLTTSTVSRLTNNAYDDKTPQVGDTYVTWWTQEGSYTQIYVYNLATGGTPLRVSKTGQNNFEPETSGGYVVWYGYDGLDNEIYVYDGVQRSGNWWRAITSNGTDDRRPQVEDNPGLVNDYVVWEAKDATDYEIGAYDLTTNLALTSLTADSANDQVPQISGTQVVWQKRSGATSVIYHKDLTSLVPSAQISDSASYHESPQIAGTDVVWHTQTNSADPKSWEVSYYELGSGRIAQNISGNTVYDGSPQISTYADGSGVSHPMAIWRTFRNGNYEVVRALQGTPQVQYTITLVVNGDVKVEPDEYFLVTLSSPYLASIDDAQAVVEILNDDGSMDLGDAPDPAYPTLMASNPARHVIATGFSLGSSVDAETNGQPGTAATGDDLAGVDDEDGVTFSSSLIRGFTAQITVSATVPAGTPAMLDAWIDWDGDGIWTDSERITAAGGTPVVNGPNALNLTVPDDARVGTTYARFRLSTVGGLSPNGTAMAGEVEDYAVPIVEGMRLLNRVLTVQGGSGADTFVFAATTSTYNVTLNGQMRSFPVADVDSITFDGGAGTDTATMSGLTSGGENVELWIDHGTFTGVAYTVTTANVEAQTANSNGDTATNPDTVIVHDGPGADTLYVNRYNQGDTKFEGPGLNLLANDFRITKAYSSVGSDTAYLYDTAADKDVFEGYTDRATMKSVTATGSTILDALVSKFRYVIANATYGGIEDVAKLYDSTGADNFEGRPTESKLYNKTTFSNKAMNFELVQAVSSGGTDVATLFDSTATTSANALTFTADASTKLASLAWTGGSLQVSKFPYVTMNSIDTAADTAVLLDSAGADTLVGYASLGQDTFSGIGFVYRTVGFKTVQAQSRTGADVAKMYDSTGADQFVARPGYAQLASPNGVTTTATGFKTMASYATEGGTDTAIFDGKAGTADAFSGSGVAASLKDAAGSYLLYASGYESVTANGTLTEGDSATLQGTSGVETFTTDFVKVGGVRDPNQPYATLAGVGFSNTVKNFRYVTGKGGVNDHAAMYAAAYTDSASTTPLAAVLYGQNTYFYYTAAANSTADKFGDVHIYGVRNTSTAPSKAKFYDEGLQVYLLSQGSQAQIKNLDATTPTFGVTLENFDSIVATATKGNKYAKKKVLAHDYALALNPADVWTDY